MIPVNSHYVNRHIEEFIKSTGIIKEQRILEVGCGMGKFTLPLLRRGYRITALDLSPFLLQQLIKYNDNAFKVDLICCDILEIPADYNNTFDAVVGFFTIHHFHHLHTHFKAMARVLKRGGLIAFTEPSAYNPLYYVQIATSPTMSWEGDKGVAMMWRKKFAQGAEWAELNLVDLHKFGFFPPFVVNTKIGRLAEQGLEKMRIFESLSAFQIIKLRKPL